MEKYFSREESMWAWTMDLNYRATLAVDFAKTYGIVSAMEDGEDSQGRAKLKLQTPREVVDRCCEMADIMVQEFEKRGWIREDLRTPEDIARRKGELGALESDIRFDFEGIMRKARKEREAAAQSQG